MALGTSVSLRRMSGHPTYNWRCFFVVGGKRRSKAFRTKKEAEAFKETKEQEISARGNVGDISSDEAMAVLEHRQFLNEMGWSVRRALEFAADHLAKTINSPNVSDGVKAFLADKRHQGVASRTISDLSSRLSAFAHVFGSSSIATVDQEDLTTYIRSKGKAQTQQNHRRIIAGFFNYARSRGWCEQNPAGSNRVRLTKVKRGPIGILTPGEAASMLAQAAPEIVSIMALALFAGIRREEIRRLGWRNIRMPTRNKAGLIQIPAEVSKTGYPRKILMAPNLSKWLLPYRKTSGPIHPQARGHGEWKVRKWFSDARGAAGIEEWPDNAFRHSFGTYRMEQTHDIGLVSEEMGNSPQMVKAHYQDAFVEPEDAEAYWDIAPTPS
jgi:integrase